jgi:putative transposase
MSGHRDRHTGYQRHRKLVRYGAPPHRALQGKLAEAAEKSWRRLDGHNQLPKLILGVKFTNGIEVVSSHAQAAAA